MTYDGWKTDASGAYDERDEPDEHEGCRDCGAEFDHEPDCMTAAAILQAIHDEEAGLPSGGDAAYGAAIRPLVEALIHAQGDTIAELRALGKLFDAHQNEWDGHP